MSEFRKTEVGKTYFLTCTVIDWIDVFVRPEYAKVIFDSLLFCRQNKGLNIYAACLMTSHMHLIAGSDAKPVTEVMRDLKRHTATTLLAAIEGNPQESRREWMMERFRKAGSLNPHNWQHQFWQQDNYPFELYSQQMIDQKMRYIYENPVKAGLVHEADAYVYSTCCKYCPLQVS